MYQMIVSMGWPNTILETQPNIQELFFYEREELLGQPLSYLVRVNSDPTLLDRAIQATADHQITRLQHVMYDRDGMEKRMLVRCSPCFEGRKYRGCRMNLKNSSAIILDEIYDHAETPHILVSAEEPRVIQQVNNRFVEKFMLSRDQALGKTLSILRGDFWQILTEIINIIRLLRKYSVRRNTTGRP